MSSDFPGTVLLVRTHYLDDNLRAFIGTLQAASSYRVCLLADESKNDMVDIGEIEKISISPDVFREIGLFVCHDVMWRCGDYCFYAARQRYPQASHFWILEPDVRFNFPNTSEFFSFFEEKAEYDFLGVRYGRSAPSWGWYASIAPYVETVHNCMFPLLRLTGRAVDVLHRRRQEIGVLHVQAEADRAERGEQLPVWPNDESFVASTLSQGGFACSDINGFGRDFHVDESFSFHRPISLRHLEQASPDNLVYHPVLAGEHYLNKLRVMLRTVWHQGTSPAHLDELFPGDVIRQLAQECSDEVAAEFGHEVSRTKTVVASPAGQAMQEMEVRSGQIVSGRVQGVQVRFFVQGLRSPIETDHAHGRFYEDVELAIISRYFQAEGTFVDIGAHVGNHSLYAALFMHAGRVIPLEPNRATATVLDINVKLNDLSSVIDVSRLGIAAMNQHGVADIYRDRDNTGLAWVVEVRADTDAPLRDEMCRVAPADEILNGEAVDFIKIDVNGAELDVLYGLLRTLRTQRPKVFINVMHHRDAQIRAVFDELGYVIAETHVRYGDAESRLMLPS